MNYFSGKSTREVESLHANLRDRVESLQAKLRPCRYMQEFAAKRDASLRTNLRGDVESLLANLRGGLESLHANLRGGLES